MMDVFGVWNEEIDSLPDGVKNSVAMDGRRYDAFELCARIHPITAEVLGTYEKDFYAGEPAVTKNRFGRGAAYYIAARTGTDMLAALYGGLIASLGIGVTAHERVGENGAVVFVENYNDAEKTVELPAGCELYGTGERVNSIKLAPFGVAVLSKFTEI